MTLRWKLLSGAMFFYSLLLWAKTVFYEKEVRNVSLGLRFIFALEPISAIALSLAFCYFLEGRKP